MALSSLLASASSARPADTIRFPAIPTTARTVAHFFMAGVPIVTLCGIRSSAIWPNETAGTMWLIWFFFRAGDRLSPGREPVLGVQRQIRRGNWLSEALGG